KLLRVRQHHRNRNINRSSGGERHDIRGHDAYDGYGGIIEADRSTNYTWIAAKSFLPVCAADYGDGTVRSASADSLIVRCRESTADQGLNSKQVVEVARDPNAANLLSIVVNPHLDVGEAESGYRLETLHVSSEGLEKRIGRAAVASLCAHILHKN